MTLENIVLKSYFKGKRGEKPMHMERPPPPKKNNCPSPPDFQKRKIRCLTQKITLNDED
mgnify:CR=1 FL=1